MSINAIRADLVYTVFFKDEFKEVVTLPDANQRLALVPCPNHPSIRYSVILTPGENVEHQERQVSEALRRCCPKHPARMDNADFRPH